MSGDKFQESLFDFSKASEFSDSQILQYWVDIAGSEGLLSLLRPKAIKPMLLLGGKGSGKTHLLRYCSGAVQKIKHANSMTKAIKEQGYLGIYAGADGANVDRFAGKGIEDEVWDRVFSYYFDLWLSVNFLNHMIELIEEGNVNENHQSEICSRIQALFDIDVKCNFSNVREACEYFNKLIREIDYACNNSALTGTLGNLEIKATPCRLVFGVPDAFSDVIPFMKNVRVVYLIDEIENFTEKQQRYLNTLIRYRSGVSTIKLGTRLYGMKTLQTRGAGEPIKHGSEYDKVELDSYLRDHEKHYSRFIKNLMQKRLEKAGASLPNKKSADFEALFEEIDSSNNYQTVTTSLLSGYAPHERPYFSRLRSEIVKFYHSKGLRRAEEAADSVVGNLSVVEHPLLEKVNILLLYRDWKEGSSLEEISIKTKELCRLYIERGKKGSPKYYSVLDHFRQDLLAQVYRDCGVKPVYAGLETLISLSQGIPRNFLELVKHTYLRSKFIDETEGLTEKISTKAQSEGVRDAALWFWEDAQPDYYGQEVREAIERLAVLLRSIRYSSKPSECSLVAFSLTASDGISPAAREVLNHAVNWSFLIRIRDGRANKNTESVDEKYRIAPMLAPKWALPESRRGSLEIPPSLFNSIFSKEDKSLFSALLEDRISSMEAPFFGRKRLAGQGDLF